MSNQEIILNGNDIQKKPKRSINIWGIIAGVAVFASVVVSYLSMEILGERIDMVLLKQPAITLGIIIMAIAVLGIIFSALGLNIPGIIAGFLSLAIWIMNYAGIVKFLNKTKEVGEEAIIHFELGSYLLLAGAISFVLSGIYGIIQKKRKDSVQQI